MEIYNDRSNRCIFSNCIFSSYAFRLWDRFEQRYLNISELHNYYISPVDGRILFLDGYDIDARYYKEQYTGLQDQNGKEIYEGDILAPTNPETIREDRIARVYFDAGVFKIGWNCLWQELAQNQSEVIGNIYENPELLEKE